MISQEKRDQIKKGGDQTPDLAGVSTEHDLLHKSVNPNRDYLRDHGLNPETQEIIDKGKLGK